jgi:phosphohistidine phosphatase SixA
MSSSSRRWPASRTARTWCCGHRPHLPRLTADLLTGDADGLDVALPKASLVSIDIPLATPEALGTLERSILEPALRELGT